MATPNHRIIEANMNIDIEVEILRGATIELIIPTAERYLRNTRVDQAYVFVGVNNLTDRHTNGKVTGTYTDQTNLVKDMERRLDYTMNTLKKVFLKLFCVMS